LVITATAIAAVIQLRHVRASNELNAALKLFAFKESAEMQRYFAFVRQVLPTKMEDASFRADFSHLPNNPPTDYKPDTISNQKAYCRVGGRQSLLIKPAEFK